MRQFLLLLTAVFTFLAVPVSAQEDPLFLDEDEKPQVEDQSQKGLKISGLIRNDAILTTPEDEARFSDILEGRLIFDYSTDNWKLYADGRLYGFFGDAVKTEGRYRASLMRAFIRWFSPGGDITVGKTYVNLGHPGLFNPFESNKKVQVTDISYDKEGILALEYQLNFGKKSGFKIYGGDNLFEDQDGKLDNQYRGGGSIWTNAWGFDMGLAANHLDIDRNLGGLYFKGDLVIGLQGAWAVHFTDSFEEPEHEVMAGIDYSFLSGKIILNALFYYTSRGVTTTDNYQLLYRSLPDQYFAARYYTHGEIKYVHDEFFNAGVYALTNCVDGSTLIVPSLSVVVTNGLTITLLFTTVTGKENDEFTGDTHGWFGTILRVEGKF